MFVEHPAARDRNMILGTAPPFTDANPSMSRNTFRTCLFPTGEFVLRGMRASLRI